jgi:hypothetical protein
MATTDTIPITITPTADAFIDRAGQRREFEAMLEHARRTIADLRAFEVELDETPGTGPPGIVIWAHRSTTPAGDDPTNWNYGAWMVRSFPPEVCINFVLISAYPDDGR